MLATTTLTYKAVLNIHCLEWENIEREAYVGKWARAKGGNSQQEMTLANQQNTLENQLAFQQLALQQGQINMVNPTLQSIISNGGFMPGVQNSLTSIAMNSLPQSYNNLFGQLSNQLVRRGVVGGQNAGGGQVAQQFGALGAQEAGQQAQLLSQIPIMGQQNTMQASQTALGVGGMYGQNVGSFNSGASSALVSGVNAGQAADQASTGFWGSLFGALTSPFQVAAKV